jgi:hypothetical protein
MNKNALSFRPLFNIAILQKKNKSWKWRILAAYVGENPCEIMCFLWDVKSHINLNTSREIEELAEFYTTLRSVRLSVCNAFSSKNTP